MRHSQVTRFYPLGLLEEAFILSEKIGPKKASIESGVNINSLSHYRQIRRRNQPGFKPRVIAPRKNSIDPLKKRACFEVYKQLLAAKFAGKRKCWIEAGKRVGINGRSVEFQYVRGIWAPPLC